MYQDRVDSRDDAEGARALLDRLLQDSRLYTSSSDFKELLDFVVKLRRFAPFNAMLLQIQKPGLSYAASAWDWRERFGRTPKAGARPLLIMWPFGPVALVYDVDDTEGRPVPEDVSSFVATGHMNSEQVSAFDARLRRKNVYCRWVDSGDLLAGSIMRVSRSIDKKVASQYQLTLNRNHSAPVSFATISHELGHLYLGHLGSDLTLGISGRSSLPHDRQELEAESVSFLVCNRNGVTSKAQTYLSAYISDATAVADLDVYQILRAAGQVENLLGLGANARSGR